MNHQKKLYQTLDATVITLEKEDVICASGGGSIPGGDSGTVLIPDWNV